MTLVAASGKPFLVVSDLHLGAVPDATERAFRRFLDYAADSGGLLINGDLWEFGIAYRNVVPRKHVRVLAKLADVVESGVPVYFAGGNHDYVEWGGHVLRDDLGVILLRDRTRMEIAGRHTLVTHGDNVGAGRTWFQSFLGRSRPVASLLRLLHPDWVERIQHHTTTTRRQAQGHAAGQGTGPKFRAPAIEAWARAELERDPSLELILAGHGHLPARVEVAPGRFYVNSGDWISHFTYALLPADGGAPQLRRWPGREEVMP